MCFTGLLKSLHYILLCGMRPSVGGFSAHREVRAARALFLARHKEECAVSFLRPHCWPTCGRPHRRGGRGCGEGQTWCVMKFGRGV